MLGDRATGIPDVIALTFLNLKPSCYRAIEHSTL
jgi:hypothetical protein